MYIIKKMEKPLFNTCVNKYIIINIKNGCLPPKITLHMIHWESPGVDQWFSNCVFMG